MPGHRHVGGLLSCGSDLQRPAGASAVTPDPPWATQNDPVASIDTKYRNGPGVCITHGSQKRFLVTPPS